MKQILILRHAKSSWEQENLKDFDRPLAPRGIHDAPMMGEFLRDIGEKPQQVISSTAQRAKETSQYVVDAFGGAVNEVQWDEDLYYGNAESYLEAIQRQDDRVDRIMLVGHNPMVEAITSGLVGSQNQASVRMPTAALVCVQTFAIRWERINWGTSQLKWMMIPKVLKQLKD